MSQAKAFQTTSAPSSIDNNSAHLSSETDFHGAAIIDENGNEVPITEEMILQACDELSCSWMFPRQTQKH